MGREGKRKERTKRKKEKITSYLTPHDQFKLFQALHPVVETVRIPLSQVIMRCVLRSSGEPFQSVPRVNTLTSPIVLSHDVIK